MILRRYVCVYIYRRSYEQYIIVYTYIYIIIYKLYIPSVMTLSETTLLGKSYQHIIFNWKNMHPPHPLITSFLTMNGFACLKVRVPCQVHLMVPHHFPIEIASNSISGQTHAVNRTRIWFPSWQRQPDHTMTTSIWRPKIETKSCWDGDIIAPVRHPSLLHPKKVTCQFHFCITKVTSTFIIPHWIGLRENLQETMVFTIKYRGFPVNFPIIPSSNSMKLS